MNCKEFILDRKDHNWICVLNKTNEKTNGQTPKKSKIELNKIKTHRRNIIDKFTNIKDCFEISFENEKQFYSVRNFWSYNFNKKHLFNIEDWKKTKTVLLFDFLYKLIDPKSFLVAIPHEKIICNSPIYPFDNPNNFHDIKKWHNYSKNYKWYWNMQGFANYIEQCGWEITYCDTGECPPRKDFWTFILERNINKFKTIKNTQNKIDPLLMSDTELWQKMKEGKFAQFSNCKFKKNQKNKQMNK